jgi:hypothetical protein
MTDKSTHDLIDEAARRIATDIIESEEMTANERMKAFATLIDYRKVVASPGDAEKAPVESFDRMRDRIRGIGIVRPFNPDNLPTEIPDESAQ